MIEEEKYKEILESGLILDHYLLLCNIKNGIQPVSNRRIQGFINLLTKKDYIKDDQLTEKGLELVENCEFAQVVEESAEKKVDFATWVVDLHVKLQHKLKELTGAIQVRPKIEGKPYSFLPNVTDLAKVLQRAISHYKLKDNEKIEKALFKHIQDCSRSGKWYPLLNYYIMKDGMSKMVTDIESDDGQEEIGEFKSNQKFI